MIAWERLIRFVATDGRILRGKPILPSTDFDLGSTTEKTKLHAKVIVGDDLYDTTGSTKVSTEVCHGKEFIRFFGESRYPDHKMFWPELRKTQ